MSYNSNLPEDEVINLSRADIKENLRALKEDKIVDAATAVVAVSAAKLTTARKISLEGDATGSTAFEGSADVAIQVDVLSADTSAQCTDNAATAIKLETARIINGVPFDGSADITITQVNDKDIATADQIVPVGGIIMWSGVIASIPSKWALCDGSNGTPNLSGRFMLGYSNNSHPIGQITHVLTVEEMAGHNHYTTYCDVYNNLSPFGNFATQKPGPGASLDDGVWPYTSSTGGNQSHNNMPPYYTLAYIMRTA